MNISLNNITLIAVSSIKINETLFALKYSSKFLDFSAIKFVSHVCPENLPNDIKFEICPELKSKDDYSYYVIYNLINHVQTDFCLLVQHDGYVIRPHLWHDSFLEWDYIGAPWAVKDNAYITKEGEHVRVGNGGFSLRSRKLLEYPKKYNMPYLEEQGFYNEDGNICVYNRNFLKNLGIKYAPVEVAAKFSYEVGVPENNGIDSFGFHGLGNIRGLHGISLQ